MIFVFLTLRSSFTHFFRDFTLFFCCLKNTGDHFSPTTRDATWHLSRTPNPRQTSRKVWVVCVRDRPWVSGTSVRTVIHRETGEVPTDDETHYRTSQTWLQGRRVPVVVCLRGEPCTNQENTHYTLRPDPQSSVSEDSLDPVINQYNRNSSLKWRPSDLKELWPLSTRMSPQ